MRCVAASHTSVERGWTPEHNVRYRGQVGMVVSAATARGCAKIMLPAPESTINVSHPSPSVWRLAMAAAGILPCAASRANIRSRIAVLPEHGRADLRSHTFGTLVPVWVRL